MKDFSGHGPENRNRMIPEKSQNEESLDIEAFKKFFCTINCLYGACTKSRESEQAAELNDVAKALFDIRTASGKQRLLLILFINMDNDMFRSRTRTAKAQMSAVQAKIRRKFTWLNADISVVNMDTYDRKLFTVRENRDKSML